MTEIILAIDPGLRTGWACSAGGAGVVNFCASDKSSAEKRHGRLGWRWAGWIGDMMTEYEPSVLVIERMVGRGLQGNAAQVLLGLRMIALAQCWAREILVEEITDGTWKAWARRNMPEWEKGDLADARAMLAYWGAVRAPQVFGE